MLIFEQDLQHQLWQILLDGQLLTAPVSRITSLLDLGCGSAVWTAAVAAQFPEADVIGVDISPSAQDRGLRNLKLVTADIERQWSFTDSQSELFDLISIRVLISAICDWSSLIRRCFDHLKPGGWIEIPDVSIGTYSDSFDWRDESSPVMRLFQCYRKAAAYSGIDGFANQKRAPCLAAANFTNISEKFFKCYLDENAVETNKDKEIARLARANMHGLLDSITKAMQERGQWDLLRITSHDLQQLKEDAKEDFVHNSASRKYYWIL